MQSLGDVISTFSRYRRRFGQLTVASMAQRPGTQAPHLAELADFGGNPGLLRAWTYAPETPAQRPPLIVALHGCGQTAADYDSVAGWSRMADETGAIILFPEQPQRNNRLLCFNWFTPRHVSREGGEAQSIRQMIEAVVLRFDCDRRRIFVTGLSAGGAMAAALLALWPDLFNAGAIIAGLPFRAAENGVAAIAAMTDGAKRGPELTQEARAASAYAGSWPRIAIWQGLADQVVHPSNSDRLVEQWLFVHGLDKEGAETVNAPFPRYVWRNAKGRVVVEQIAIEELGHGVPVAGQESGQRFAVDIGLSSTREIAKFWGLLADEAETRRRAAASAIWR